MFVRIVDNFVVTVMCYSRTERLFNFSLSTRYYGTLLYIMIEKNGFCDTLRHDVRCLKKMVSEDKIIGTKQKRYDTRHPPRFTINVVFSVQRFMQRGFT